MNTKKRFILTTLATSIIAICTALTTLYYLRKQEKLPRQNGNQKDAELIKLDSLLKQKTYYNKLLTDEVAGDTAGHAGFGPRALFLQQKISKIDSAIKIIVPNDTIR